MSTATKQMARRIRKANAPPAEPPQAQPAMGWPEISNVPAQQLPCAALLRHPLNRYPSAAAFAAIAESLERVRQLEPIVVRPVVDECIDGPCYQILSGETRWRAALQLGWREIAARVIELDDAQALVLVAEANEARKDLTTCERARLIHRLCLSPAEGGSGLTREQAGRLFGLESGAAASNLVKLLDAPEPWQRRLDQPDVDCDGDTVTIHQGTVRAIAQLAAASPAVAAALEDQYAKGVREGRDRTSYPGVSRDEQLQWVTDTVTDAVRVLSEPRYYGYQYGGDHPCYLDLQDAELLAQLEIVELPIGGKKGNDLVRCATNVKLFDELQIAEIVKRQASKSKGGDRATSKAATAELTPKERAKAEREKRKEQDEQLAKWVRDWKHRLLRAALADSLDGDQAVWVLPWLMAAGSGSWRTPLQDLLFYSIETSRVRWLESLPDKSRKPGLLSRQYDVASVLELAECLHHKHQSMERAEARAIHQSLARLLLWPADSDTRDEKLIAADLPEQLPYYCHEDIEQLAQWAGVSVAEAWTNGATDGSVERRLIVQFLERHTLSQLTDLGRELNVGWEGQTKKSAAVLDVLAAHKPGKPLPLPQLLQDKPAKATSKAKR